MAARVRRTPDEARELILAAAGRVFERDSPDRVGLKDVAREASVSHALVSHYFGTYEALVEATLERRLTATRQRMLELIAARVSAAGTSAPLALLTEVRGALAEAWGTRGARSFVAWALASGRVDASDFFSHRAQGLKQVVDLLDARAEGAVPRARLEFAVMTAVGLTLAWNFGGNALLGALGKTTSTPDEANRWFDDHLRELLEVYVTPAPPHR